VIHYHGGPITPLSVAVDVWTRRHAFVSFERPDQVALAAEVCQTFAIDNGAYSVWQRGATFDIHAYLDFVQQWERHPGFDWCILPDVIDGDEAANELALATWGKLGGKLLTNVPVWHLHESLERLGRLCREYPRVAFGSSGQWAEIGTPGWWERMGAAMDHICDAEGRPPCKLHGLRMLNPTVFSQLPFSSADSSNVAQNHVRERQMYHLTGTMGGLVLIDRIERHASAPRWTRTFGTQFNMDLVG